MLSIGLRLSLICATCLRPRDEREIDEALVEALLFGIADPYAVCPICFRRVGYDRRRDEEYRRLVRVAYYEKFGRVLKEKEAPR